MHAVEPPKNLSHPLGRPATPHAASCWFDQITSDGLCWLTLCVVGVLDKQRCAWVGCCRGLLQPVPLHMPCLLNSALTFTPRPPSTCLSQCFAPFLLRQRFAAALPPTLFRAPPGPTHDNLYGCWLDAPNLHSCTSVSCRCPSATAHSLAQAFSLLPPLPYTEQSALCSVRVTAWWNCTSTSGMHSSAIARKAPAFPCGRFGHS